MLKCWFLLGVEAVDGVGARDGVWDRAGAGVGAEVWGRRLGVKERC